MQDGNAAANGILRLAMRLTLSLSAAFLAAAAIGATLQSADAVKKEIQKLYDQQAKSWIALDQKALEDFYRKRTAPDYAGVADGVKRSREQVIATIGPVVKSTKRMAGYSIKVQKLSLKGNSATVTTVGKIDAEVLDREMKTHRVQLEQSAVTVWVKSKDGWRAKSSKITTLKRLIDGKAPPGGER